MEPSSEPRIAVVIPCRDEERTIGKVVDDFRRELPSASIFVIDNRSSDASAKVASEKGAKVLRECRPGKGFVVETMFDRIDADYYVMVDGDDTYPAESVHELLRPVVKGETDMAVGARLGDYTDESFRPLHVLGNRVVCRLANWIGGARLTDIMSGYRAFNRRVVERIPVVSPGFEVETDMTLQMLYYRLGIVEVPVRYRERPHGSHSKLRTFADGARVLWKLFSLLRAFKPLTFFGSLGLVFLAAGIAAGIPPIHDYVTRPDRYVEHVPLAILATGLVILAAGSVFLGILLHAVNWRFLELHNVMVRRRSPAEARIRLPGGIKGASDVDEGTD